VRSDDRLSGFRGPTLLEAKLRSVDALLDSRRIFTTDTPRLALRKAGLADGPTIA
jgi:hypothetical protein